MNGDDFPTLETITVEHLDGSTATWFVSPEDMDRATETLRSLLGEPDSIYC